MYKQLTSSQRYVIKNGLKENVPLRMIARLIGVSPSTVSREIKRSSSKTGVFIPALANEMARGNRARSARNRRTKKRYRYKVLTLLTKYQWSPEQISGTLRKEGISISHETIYQWIRKNKARGGSLYLTVVISSNIGVEVFTRNPLPLISLTESLSIRDLRRSRGRDLGTLRWIPLLPKDRSLPSLPLSRNLPTCVLSRKLMEVLIQRQLLKQLSCCCSPIRINSRLLLPTTGLNLEITTQLLVCSVFRSSLPTPTLLAKRGPSRIPTNSSDNTSLKNLISLTSMTIDYLKSRLYSTTDPGRNMSTFPLSNFSPHSSSLLHFVLESTSRNCSVSLSK